MALICWKWQDMSVASTISTTRVRSSLEERGETLLGCHEMKGNLSLHTNHKPRAMTR